VSCHGKNLLASVIALKTVADVQARVNYRQAFTCMSSDKITHSEFPGFSLKNIMEHCVVVHGGCDSTLIAIGKVYFPQSSWTVHRFGRVMTDEHINLTAIGGIGMTVITRLFETAGQRRYEAAGQSDSRRQFAGRGLFASKDQVEHAKLIMSPCDGGAAALDKLYVSFGGGEFRVLSVSNWPDADGRKMAIYRPIYGQRERSSFVTVFRGLTRRVLGRFCGQPTHGLENHFYAPSSAHSD